MPNFTEIGQSIIKTSQFFEFQDASHPLSWILKIKILMVNTFKGQGADQILWRSVKPLPRCGDFRFFKMAATAVLDFKIFRFVTIVMYASLTKFRGDQSNCCWDMVIFRFFFKMAVVRHLQFVMWVFGPPNDCAKFCWIWCSSFDSLQVLIF